MSNRHDRSTLQQIAHEAMRVAGFLPEFSAEAMAQLNAIPSAAVNPNIRDLRNLAWCSIDNDDSRDLDQLSVAEALPDGAIKVLVAIADVDALVQKDTPIDAHAQHNTTSVYTAAQIFPMLPERLSTDLSSLGFNADRQAVVVELVIAADGSLRSSDLYPAMVKNKAKLAYNSVAAWLDGAGPIPQPITTVDGLDANIRLQDSAAQKLRELRHTHGALNFESLETRPVFDGDTVTDLALQEVNRAKELIEDFMIAANGVTARFLDTKQFPSIRRIVRIPKRWDRIVELADEHGYKLPATPDSKALNQFLISAKAADPIRFPDLSLSVIKLMGAGEYVVEMPGQDSSGHFGLAVRDYAHSTAPNRRYPDLLTQRLVKAALAGQAIPYTKAELDVLAQHCTDAEDAAKKVERQLAKSAAAILLESRIGDTFDAIVTGASDKGTWVRLFQPPIEGKLVEGFRGLDVGVRVKVQLTHTDVARGFLDFRRVR